MSLWHKLAACIAFGAMAGVGCVTDAPEEVSDPEPEVAVVQQTVLAAPAPTICTLGGVQDWCNANQNGNTQALGGSSNPCAQMCGTLSSSYHALVGAATSITSDIFETTMGQWTLCLGAAGLDAYALYSLWSDPWCADNPISCGISLFAGGICMAQECFTSVLSTNPYVAALAAVCDIGPVLGAAIERNGYCNQCITHINSEISMPINPEQGCFCERQEIWWGYLWNTNCGVSHTWAQTGTAQANCVDHDSDWLAAASPACTAAGAPSGSTFYRYSNCQFCTSDQPCWPAFQNALQQFQAFIQPPPPPVPVAVDAPDLPPPPP